MFVQIVILISSLGLNFTNAVQSGTTCNNRKVHFSKDGKDFNFSWRTNQNQTFSWTQGRKYCKSHCMDLMSIESEEDWKTLVQILQTENLKYTWTSGRKCNYPGCTHKSLQPVIENGWFWANSKKRIPNPFSGSCNFCEWGPTGALKKRQPDNRQFVLDNLDEGCLAILNNLYKDGIKWHDVACHHKKPILCRDL